MRAALAAAIAGTLLIGGTVVVAAVSAGDGTQPGGPCAATTLSSSGAAGPNVVVPQAAAPSVAVQAAANAAGGVQGGVYQQTVPATSTSPAQAVAGGGGGAAFDPDKVTVRATAGTTVAGVTMTAAQMHNAAVIVAVAKAMGITERGARIGLATAMQESTFNEFAVLEKFVGLFQQSPPEDGIYTAYPRTDPPGSAYMFFTELKKRVPGYDTDPRTDYEISDVVQESGQALNVAQWAPMATQLATTLWAGVGGSTAVTGGVRAAAATAVLAGGNGVAACAEQDAYTAAAGARSGGAQATWDAGNIASDAVFYNPAAMTAAQIDAFIATQDAGCAQSNPWCLKNLTVSYPAKSWPDGYCQPIPAASSVSAGAAIAAAATACGINPQVMLTKMETESQGLTRANPTASSYAAAWGWNCPDAADGSAACSSDPAVNGFANQLQGMSHTWAKLKVEVPQHKWNYSVGTFSILWNTENTGCGGGSVDIKNVATASLYVYTPYQPNAASLAAYPGEGDACSSYGNRNFFFLFHKYFGDTGGGIVPAGSAAVAQTGAPAAGGGRAVTVSGSTPLGPNKVTVSGNVVTIPTGLADIPAAMQGQQVIAPTPQVATAIAAGMTWIGTPYSWGGGGAGGPTLGICGPDGAENDCHVIGFDCSGLTRYVASVFGAAIPQVSGDQRDASHAVDFSQAQPGDVIGYSGHVTIYIGTYGGVRMQLEAPESGENLRIHTLEGGPDSSVYRYWTDTTAV